MRPFVAVVLIGFAMLALGGYEKLVREPTTLAR